MQIANAYATFSFRCGNMACSDSWSISVLNLWRSFSPDAFCAAGRAPIVVAIYLTGTAAHPNARNGALAAVGAAVACQPPRGSGTY